MPAIARVEESRVMLIMMLLMLVFWIVVIAAVVFGVRLARSSSTNYQSSNNVVPGVPTRAPKSWAGEHSTEARLHRRLRDAVSAVRANPALDDVAFIEAKSMVEQEALAVDDRLVAVAALSPRHRGERLRPITEAVEAIEGVVAEMVDATVATADTAAALDAVRTRLELVAQARAELEGLDSGARMEELRQGLESEPEQPSTAGDPSAEDPPAEESGDDQQSPGM